MKILAKALEEFENFLIEEDCFSQFCTNLQESLKISFNEYPDYLIHVYRDSIIRLCNDMVDLFVAIPFVWGATKQGYDYWANINKKWRGRSKNFSNNS